MARLFAVHSKQMISSFCEAALRLSSSASANRRRNGKNYSGGFVLDMARKPGILYYGAVKIISDWHEKIVTT
jgi:hypothetical protein